MQTRCSPQVVTSKSLTPQSPEQYHQIHHQYRAWGSNPQFADAQKTFQRVPAAAAAAACSTPEPGTSKQALLTESRQRVQYVSGWKRLQMHLEQCESVRVQGGCLRRLHHLPSRPWPQQQQRGHRSQQQPPPGNPSNVSTKSPLLLARIGIFCRE